MEGSLIESIDSLFYWRDANETVPLGRRVSTFVLAITCPNNRVSRLHHNPLI